MAKRLRPIPHDAFCRTYRRLLLRALVQQQAERCAYCGRGMVSVGRETDRATLDEKTPRWMGGRVDRNNCVAACLGCNNEKGAIPAEVYVALRGRQIPTDQMVAIQKYWVGVAVQTRTAA